MNNLPAFPKDSADRPEMQGLSKREYACIHCGVPETGDPDIDAIIAKGNEYRHEIQNVAKGDPNYSLDGQLILEALDHQ